MTARPSAVHCAAAWQMTSKVDAHSLDVGGGGKPASGSGGTLGGAVAMGGDDAVAEGLAGGSLAPESGESPVCGVPPVPAVVSFPPQPAAPRRRKGRGRRTTVDGRSMGRIRTPMA